MGWKESPTTPAKLLAEFTGTCVLVFTACSSGMGGGPLAPLSVAAALAACVYALGGVSGAHFNPAVSMALALADCAGHGDFDCGLAWLYITVQLVAGLAGSFAAALLWGTDLGGPTSTLANATAVIQAGALEHPAAALGSPGGAYDAGRVMSAEAIYTALLVFVVLSVATCGDERRGGEVAGQNHYHGLAIGLALVAGAAAVGHISGCALNPAVSLGVAMSAAVFGGGGASFGSMLTAFFLYSGAELFGAAVAFGAFLAVRRGLLDGGEAAACSRILAELLGTYVLVLTVCLVLGAPGGSGGALGVAGVASSLAAMVYSTAAVSGANFNPAVSLGLLLTGNLHVLDFALYVMAQLLGGMLAAGTACFLERDGWDVALVAVEGGPHAPQVTLAHGSWAAVLCSEAFYTFLLVLVALRAGVQDAPNQYHGLALGLVVVAGGVAVGGLSGGCFNPAVALSVDFGSVLAAARSPGAQYGKGYAYAGAELAGAALAAGLFCAVGSTEDAEDYISYSRASDTDEEQELRRMG